MTRRRLLQALRRDDEGRIALLVIVLTVAVLASFLAPDVRARTYLPASAEPLGRNTVSLEPAR